MGNLDHLRVLLIVTLSFLVVQGLDDATYGRDTRHLKRAGIPVGLEHDGVPVDDDMLARHNLNVIRRASLTNVEPSFRMMDPWANGRLIKDGEKPLGKGKFGIVYRAFDVELGIWVAAKEIGIADFESFHQELTLLRAAGPSDFIVKVYSAFKYDFLCVTMELMNGGELFAYLRKELRITMANASRMIKRMAEAVKHLHDRNIVHLDLKIENFGFRTVNGRVDDLVLFDFGLSQQLRPGQSMFCPWGTVGFIPKYRMQGRCTLDRLKTSDTYALGKVLFELVFGYGVKDADNKLVHRIDNPDLRDLLSQLLHENPRYHMTADELLAHRFLQEPTARGYAAISDAPERPKIMRTLNSNPHAVNKELAVLKLDPFKDGRLKAMHNQIIPSLGDICLTTFADHPVLASIAPRTSSVELGVANAMDVMIACNCESIINFRGAFEYDGKLMIAKDYLSGPTLDEVRERQRGGAFKLKKVAIFFNVVVRAVAAMHSKGFTHGGLRLKAFRFRHRTPLVAKDLIMVDVGRGGASRSDDMYSLGVLLFKLATGEEPMSGSSSGQFQRVVERLQRFPCQLRLLILNLFTSNLRLTCEDVLESGFISRHLTPFSYILNTLSCSSRKMSDVISRDSSSNDLLVYSDTSDRSFTL